MIRYGKAAGWLHLPVTVFTQWAELHDVTSRNTTTIGTIPGQADRGSTILASADIDAPTDLSMVLVTIPRDLILSLDRVHEHAKCDQDFRLLLDALGDFGKTPRGAILTFLLFQCFISHPSMHSKTGVPCAFTDYIKFLPLAPLPTSWSDSDLQAARTTTLYPATKAKLASLHREFDLIQSLTRRIPFCASHWWDDLNGLVTFDDWLQVDAMYRSRALDFPGIGHCMVPGLDMANHAAGDLTRAIYETNHSGDAVLLLRPGQSLTAGQEITITYGDDKGACEMLFSYGFLDDHSAASAREIFLDLALFDNDPLFKPKLALSDAAPGVKIIETPPDGNDDADGARISFESDFVWLMCVNGDDGLNFRIRKTTDDDTELVAFWDDTEMSGLHQILEFIKEGPMWDVFQLRAATVLQDRVATQLQGFVDTEEEAARLASVADGKRELGLALKLRALEYDLAGAAYEYFEDLKMTLAAKDSVKTYLAAMSGNDARPAQAANTHDADTDEHEEFR